MPPLAHRAGDHPEGCGLGRRERLRTVMGNGPPRGAGGRRDRAGRAE